MTVEPEPPAPEEPPVSGSGGGGGGIGTWFANATGPIQSGQGDQYIYFNSGEIPKRMRQQPLGEEVRRLEQRFVEPPGWERAAAALATEGTVLLSGQQGSGIRAAALRLLSVCGSESRGAIRELLLPDSRNSDPDLLRPDDVVEDDRLLVDLLDNHERLSVFQRELPAFRNAVHEQNAYLVVVLPRDRTWDIEPEVRSLLVHLGRPDGMVVLSRHLQVEDLEYKPGARETEVEAWAASAPMRNIASLASNVLKAKERDLAASFDDWFERAWNAPETAAKIVADIRSCRDKQLLPLMLATATFEGCTVDTVFNAEQKLLDSLEYLPGDHALSRPDLAHRLQEIATRTGPKSRVHFIAPRHGPAVLEHFWVNYPGLRDGFRNWIIACGEVAGLDETEWRSAACRFADQVLRVGRPGDLIHAAAEWASSRRAWMLAPAEELFVRGLRDPEGGRAVRRQFYEWSKAPRLHPDLAYLVVALCVQEIEPDRPGEALTRLHHLHVHHSDAEVSRSAGGVLVKLAANAGFLRRILSRLAEAERDRMAVPKNHELFLRIADPELLTDTAHRNRPLASDPVVRSQLVTCWRFVLAGRRTEYEKVVRNWLTVHAHTDGSEPLLTVLVEACEGAIEPLSALFVIGLDWLHELATDAESAAQRVAAFRRLGAVIDQARIAARPASEWPIEGNDER